MHTNMHANIYHTLKTYIEGWPTDQPFQHAYHNILKVLVNLQIPWIDGSFVATEIFMLEGTLKHVGNLGWREEKTQSVWKKEWEQLYWHAITIKDNKSQSWVINWCDTVLPAHLQGKHADKLQLPLVLQTGVALTVIGVHKAYSVENLSKPCVCVGEWGMHVHSHQYNM